MFYEEFRPFNVLRCHPDPTRRNIDTDLAVAAITVLRDPRASCHGVVHFVVKTGHFNGGRIYRAHGYVGGYLKFVGESKLTTSLREAVGHIQHLARAYRRTNCQQP